VETEDRRKLSLQKNLAQIDPSSLFLYHYYEASVGLFRTLSDLSQEEAENVLMRLRQEDRTFAAQRKADYLATRCELEQHLRRLFCEKGGQPRRLAPHYMIVGECSWLRGWYKDGRAVSMALDAFHPLSLSFTYGDSFPAMRVQDGKPYRGQVYTLGEIVEIIKQYGLPQNWNADGSKGPERYIEAQMWDEMSLFTDPETGPYTA
jgi:hypothetical protein